MNRCDPAAPKCRLCRKTLFRSAAGWVGVSQNLGKEWHKMRISPGDFKCFTRFKQLKYAKMNGFFSSDVMRMIHHLNSWRIRGSTWINQPSSSGDLLLAARRVQNCDFASKHGDQPRRMLMKFIYEWAMLGNESLTPKILLKPNKKRHNYYDK